MTALNTTIEAGFDVIYYALNDDDGFPLGGTGIAVAGNADGSPALRLDGAQTVDLSLPEDEIVVAVGDDIPMVNFSFIGSELPAGVLEVASKDFDAQGRFSGVTKRTFVGTEQLPRGTEAEKASVALLLQRQAKSWFSGFKGVKKRAALYLPACEISPLGAPYNQRSVDAQRLSISASNADRHIHGETFSIANDTVENAPLIDIASPDLVHQHAFRGNGVNVTFNLQYTPLVPATNVALTLEGVLQAYTGDYAIAANVITFVAAPPDNERVIVYYQFDRSELS